MKIHTNTITPADLNAAAPKGCRIEAIKKGSRSHAYAYEISMDAKPGNDAHGIKRRYAPSSREPGRRACTWIEWGDMFAHLFTVDPTMKAGPYENADSFIHETTRAAQWRDERENAPEHVSRWADQVWSAV